MNPPRLYVDAQFASPYAMSAHVALVEKGMAFDVVKVDLDAGEQGRPAYSGLSLTQRVPTFVHEGFALSESSAIAEYLDEIHAGTPLYPQAPKMRARARQVQAWLRSDLMGLRAERTTEVIFRRPVDKPLTESGRAAAAKLFAIAGSLLPEGAPHLFGDWSIADADLALMLNRLVLNGDEVPARLAGYARAQWQRPSVAQWVAMPRTWSR